jgi:hypothetical protein
MRNTVAKHLRRAALSEMIGDGVPKRELVAGHNSVVNSPSSVHAMYKKLKKAYKKIRATTDEPLPINTRKRNASRHYVPQDLSARPALILSPLKHLRKMFPPMRTPTGGMELSPVVQAAEMAASFGWGRTLQNMARFHVL